MQPIHHPVLVARVTSMKGHQDISLLCGAILCPHRMQTSMVGMARDKNVLLASPGIETRPQDQKMNPI